MATGTPVGRGTELAALRALLDAARDGAGGALVLVGPPGIGKSHLLGATVSYAAQSTTLVLSMVGVEAERDVPFAGLFALLAPVLDHTDVLTGAQLRALAVALGQVEGEPPGRMVLGGALLALLSACSDDRPVLVLVDDLQWVDEPSAEVLVFAARRLHVERVVVVVASRPPEDRGSGTLAALLRSLPCLALGGLDRSAAALLVPHVSPRVLDTLLDRTAGNPLAILEITDVLATDELTGVKQLRSLPATSAADAYGLRLASLAPAPRRAARVLALSGGLAPGVVDEVLRHVGLTSIDLEPLGAAGLGRLDPEGASWRHPLARAVAADGTAAEVREVHRALAEVLAHDPVHRTTAAWHRAAATYGPDDGVADELAAVAALSESRAAHLEAADGWERAAELTDDPERRRSWLGLAGTAAHVGGASLRAASLLDRSLDLGRDAVLLQQRGRIEHGLGQPTRAFAFLDEAARTGDDLRRRTWSAAEAVMAGMYARRLDLARGAAEQAVATHDPTDPVQRFLAAHASAAAAALAGDLPGAAPVMRDAMDQLLHDRLLDEHDDLLLWAVNADLFLDDVRTHDPQIEAALTRMRASGELAWSPRVVRLDGIRELARGRWTAAYASFAEALELSRLAGQRTQVAEALLALAGVEASRGQQDEAVAHLDEAREVLATLEVRWLEHALAFHTAELHAGAGELEQAETAYLACLGKVSWAAPGLLAVRQARGLPLSAEDVAVEVSDDAARRVADALLVADTSASARALVGCLEDGLDVYLAARVRLLAGERFRRAGERREAREQLREAERVFEALGAAPWLSRTRAELRASGATLRRDATGEELTPSELRVATLVVQGLSNKEVAAALFLSDKTVEFHLGRVFRKLDVRNRTALAARLPR